MHTDAPVEVFTLDTNTKRILVTGSRDWDDISTIFDSLRYLMSKWGTDIVVVHGGARGADTIAGQWAQVQFVQEEIHLADWDKHGKRAGFIRNAEMVALGADVCLAFIKNESKGATMCAELAEKAGIPLYRVRI